MIQIEEGTRCTLSIIKNQVELLKEAFNKTYRDPNFTRNTRNSPSSRGGSASG